MRIMPKTRISFVTPGLLLTALFILSCGSNEVAQKEERPVSVRATVVSISDEQVTRSFTGSLEGEKQADIYAKIAEVVERVEVREGRRVSEGQMLIMLDKSGPSSMYRNTESLFRNAEKNFHKMEYLHKEGAVSEAQFDAARTEYEVSRASFEAAARLVEIQSPISGIVTSLDVSVGDYLNLGQKLATIASVDRLRAKFGVNSRDVAHINEGDAVTVSAAEIAHGAEGRVVSVSRSADPNTRAFQVEVLLDNTELLYRPGMFVRVSTVVEELHDVVVIPRDAVVDLDGRETVFIVSGEIAHKRPVTLGVELDGRAVITDGLNAGDTLVTLGQSYLDEGFKVNVAGLEKSGP